jgi:hypothetical protein
MAFVDVVSGRMAFDPTRNFEKIKLTDQVLASMSAAVDTLDEIWEQELLKILRADRKLKPHMDKESSDQEVFALAACNPQLLPKRVGTLLVNYCRVFWSGFSFLTFGLLSPNRPVAFDFSISSEDCGLLRLWDRHARAPGRHQSRERLRSVALRLV